VYFQRGFDITQATQVEGTFPVISSSGITSYHNEFKVEGPGIVIGRKGTLGSVHFSSGPFWPHDTTLWSKDLNGNDPRFVFHFMRGLDVKRFNVGNANPTLNRNHIHDLKIRIPDLPTQQRIAEILSAYDDLIENNQRRMKLLEESARLLYQEWFVHLRFPGHEHAKIVDGVPEGWARRSFSELATFTNGYPFKPEELGDVGMPVVKIPELREGVLPKTPRNSGDGIPEKYLLRAGDLLFSWSGTLLINFWREGDAILNQHLFRVDPIQQNSREYLLLALRDALPEFTNQTTGATLKHIRKSALDTVTGWSPASLVSRSFVEHVQPLFQQIQSLNSQNQKLRAARDLLLPRLMNGEVEA
jgi:type I restriction enzyme S subunit